MYALCNRRREHAKFCGKVFCLFSLYKHFHSFIRYCGLMWTFFPQLTLENGSLMLEVLSLSGRKSARCVIVESP